MIRVIIFDFGGVLGSEADDWEKHFGGILKLTGLNASELGVIWTKHWSDLKVGKEELSEFWKDVCGVSKNPVDGNQLEQLYLSSTAIYPDAISVVETLKQKSYRLVLLANESRTGMDTKIEKFGLNNLFEKVYGSAHLGLAKPNKEAFIYVLNDLNIKPEEALLVDNLEKNILAASELGISTIHFINAEQLEEKLHTLGIL